MGVPQPSSAVQSPESWSKELERAPCGGGSRRWSPLRWALGKDMGLWVLGSRGTLQCWGDLYMRGFHWGRCSQSTDMLAQAKF